MRTIKFRGKNITTNKWVYGNLLYNTLINKYFIIAMNDNNNLIEVNADTIEKYTGIKDNDDIDIYENDIVEITIPFRNGYSKPIVKKRIIGYLNKLAAFVVRNWGIVLRDNWLGGYDPSVIFKIIGNIHDNSTLLKKM